MAHEAQRLFCEGVKKRFPEHFKQKKVLDIGSLDVNGNNRYLFEDCQYTGLDIGPGPNVDVVGFAHNHDGSYDVIICTEMLEHDFYIDYALARFHKLLNPGGLLIITCAATGRPEHGTVKSKPEDSPLTVKIDQWKEYYMPLSIAFLFEKIGVEYFEWLEVRETHGCDLQFWGIKNDF